MKHTSWSSQINASSYESIYGWVLISHQNTGSCNGAIASKSRNVSGVPLALAWLVFHHPRYALALPAPSPSSRCFIMHALQFNLLLATVLFLELVQNVALFGMFSHMRIALLIFFTCRLPCFQNFVDSWHKPCSFTIGIYFSCIISHKLMLFTPFSFSVLKACRHFDFSSFRTTFGSCYVL